MQTIAGNALRDFGFESPVSRLPCQFSVFAGNSKALNSVNGHDRRGFQKSFHRVYRLRSSACTRSAHNPGEALRRGTRFFQGILNVSYSLPPVSALVTTTLHKASYYIGPCFLA